MEGRAKITRLARMRAFLGKELMHNRILNEVLVAQTHPAGTTRYTIKLRGRKETHRSSGIWISTPAGSTAAIRAAGGKILPIRSKRLQYQVRELFRPPGVPLRLSGGVVPTTESLRVVSRMMGGKLYLDGPRREVTFPIGSQARFDMQGPPLSVVALDHDRRRQWER
jgi:NAD+ kinase